MKSFFQLKKFVGVAAAASVAAGAITFMTMGVLADETVSYYGLSENGSVISGTVTDYTNITGSDVSWGVVGSETWYVAQSGSVTIHNGSPVTLCGDVNIILKDGAEVTVEGGVYGDNATLTFYSETENGNGIMAFIGKQGSEGGMGQSGSGSDKAVGKNGEAGNIAVDVKSLTVKGGTVTAVGGKGGKGGCGGSYYRYEDADQVEYYSPGGNGGNGASAVSDDTKVYLYGGTFNATAGRGGDRGENTYAPSDTQEQCKGQIGEDGTAIKGVYAVNGTLNVNKRDASDPADTSGDYELYSVNMYKGSKLKLTGLGKATVAGGTEIKSYGDIEVSGELFVDDNGVIFTNGNITAVGGGKKSKTAEATVKRFTPVAGEGYTLDYHEGCVDIIDGYYMNGSLDGMAWLGATAETIADNKNRFSITHLGDEYDSNIEIENLFIDSSDCAWFNVPYVVVNNSSSLVKPIDYDILKDVGDNIQLNFELEQPEDYVFSGISVTDGKGTAISPDKYEFDTTTGIFKADSISNNMFIEVLTQTKTVAIELIGENDASVSTVDLGTEYDKGSPEISQTLKVKVTEGGSITKYKVIKETDFSKTAFEAAADTSKFIVNYTNGSIWGNADDSSAAIGLNETASFTIMPKSGLSAGTYTESYIIVTDKTVFGDIAAGTIDQALVHFTITYKVEHESSGRLSFTDLSGHYDVCKNCIKTFNKTAHTFNVMTVSNSTFAKAADCTTPAKYYYSCECGAHTDDDALTFESGEPDGHSFGDWSIEIPAGCVTQGREKHTCTVCGYQENREVQPTGHSWENDYTVDKEPNCTEKGSKSIHCSACDETKDTTEIPANGHSFGEWTMLNVQDCTQGGTKQHTCTICNFTEFAVIPPQEHLWDNDFTIDTAPTCTNSGVKSIHCSRCDAVKDVTEIEPDGHVFTDWSVSSDATCVEKGQKTRSCEVCGYTEYDDTDIDTDAHLWEDDFTIDKEPTCTTEGSKSIHCSRCSATKDSETIPVADHQYGEWKTTKEATCTVDGLRVRECVNCGKTEENIIASAHVWDDKLTVDKEPTCTDEGSQSIHCTKCDAQKEIQSIPANGHDWSEWEVIKKSTATVNGIEERHCHVCDAVEKNEIDLLADDTSDTPDSKPEEPGTDEPGWNSDEKHHWHLDPNGNKIDVEEHEFKWVVDKEPNGTEPGIGHYECISCDYAKFPIEFGGKDSPETGSESLALWIAAAFVAGGVAPIALKIKSKKNK